MLVLGQVGEKFGTGENGPGRVKHHGPAGLEDIPESKTKSPQAQDGIDFARNWNAPPAVIADPGNEEELLEHSGFLLFDGRSGNRARMLASGETRRDAAAMRRMNTQHTPVKPRYTAPHSQVNWGSNAMN